MFEVFGRRFSRDAAPFSSAIGKRARFDLQSIAQAANLVVAGELVCELRRAPQSDDIRHRLSSRPSTLLLSSANHEWRQNYSASYVKRAHAFRSMKLMTRDRKQIDRQFFQVDGNLSHGLHAIDVKQCGRIVSYDAAKLLNRKQDTSFIVCHHHGNDSGVGPQSLTQIIEIKLAITIYFQPRYFASDVGQMLTETSNCLVFDGLS